MAEESAVRLMDGTNVHDGSMVFGVTVARICFAIPSVSYICSINGCEEWGYTKLTHRRKTKRVDGSCGVPSAANKNTKFSFSSSLSLFFFLFFFSCKTTLLCRFWRGSDSVEWEARGGGREKDDLNWIWLVVWCEVIKKV